jgi:radical SAM superfamily enzyme YgiQ (UPF0313 family)
VRITLVAPASDVSRRTGRRPKGTPFFHYYKLGLATIAGATPPHHRVEVIDELVDLWDPATHSTDAVGISVMTALAPRAYAIADALRARGIPVILGGMHPSVRPDEAASHADAVVVGQGEFAWPAVCADLEAGRLQPIYADCARPREIRVPPARRDLYANRFYPSLDIVQFTRGCAHKCRFCSVTEFFDGRHHTRPIDDVRAEFPSLTRRHLMVADDNLYADRRYCLDALAALAPLKKYVGVQGTMDIAFDDEVMEAARRARVSAIFVGLESIVEDSLAESKKLMNAVDRYAEAIERFHRYGVFVEAGLMFGFDHDDAGVFDRTIDVMERIGVDVLQIGVVTPMPGTPLFDQLESEGRLIERRWEFYDCNHVVFTPRLMSVEQLSSGVAHARRRFYAKRAIARRSWSAFRRFDLVTWATQTALNLGFRHNHNLGLDYPP